MKPKPGDISIVDKTGTFLLWYDTPFNRLLTCLPERLKIPREKECSRD